MHRATSFQAVRIQTKKNPLMTLYFRGTQNLLSSTRAKRASSKGERASRARAVTVSQCPHSEVGQDFLLRRRVTLTETAVTRKRKV